MFRKSGSGENTQEINQLSSRNPQGMFKITEFGRNRECMRSSDLGGSQRTQEQFK